MPMDSAKGLLILLSASVPQKQENHLENEDKAFCMMAQKGPSKVFLYYFSSMIYSNEDKWTIWINDERIQKEQLNQLDISITVKNDHIEIEKDGVLYTLFPDQTFDAKHGKIYNSDKRKTLKDDNFESEDLKQDTIDLK